MILNVPTPDNITGIKITATSENVTAIYEKHTHCLKLNMSKKFTTCDLVEYQYHNFTEISPFGLDSYLLQYEPDYDINVTLYTPFELIDAVVTAKARGLTVIGMTGQNGGSMKQHCDIAICVPSDSTPKVQEYHLPVYHTICQIVENRFF